MHLRQWNFVETTTSGQPVLRENEKDIYVEHAVGCYQGKSKILGRQKGRIYLTSQRIIYIDDERPTFNSVSLELDDISSVEYSSKFLRKSARLSIFLKDLSFDANDSPTGPMALENKTIWSCPICGSQNETLASLSSSNISSFACSNCGIVPDYNMIESSVAPPSSINTTPIEDHQSSNTEELECAACTYLNHPSLRNCEICGTRLPIENAEDGAPRLTDKRVKIELETKDGLTEGEPVFVQLSFRMSDGMLLSQTISKLLESQQREKTQKVYNKGVTLVNGRNVQPKRLEIFDLETKLNRIGIASLEKSQENQLINNDIILGNALSDLNNLMALASDIEKLYNTKQRTESQKKAPLLIVDREKFLTKDLFINEISRELHSFIMTEFQEQKKAEGVILVSLVDIYALYNKAMRIGSGLISPQELREACKKFDELGLSELQLTRINGRVLCISSGDSFGFIKKKILDIVNTTPGADLLELSQQLNDNNANSWTVGIIMEALNNCVNEGQLLVDEQITGVHYYVNFDWRI
ncbi:LANO_0G11474g1_1 [Lachancea nothofagi CBS 11611]|uniref:Vacuolar protein-sorting-associated protein 36 n=1 Tax=Lachancea nothofagi CBS 11611 TaxID=1266666 RepID=A0A1G4KJU8_9SACH|nr:LANO_0G11474g1_1 [Lachancea nothofagi CBS 11611]